MRSDWLVNFDLTWAGQLGRLQCQSLTIRGDLQTLSKITQCVPWRDQWHFLLKSLQALLKALLLPSSALRLLNLSGNKSVGKVSLQCWCPIVQKYKIVLTGHYNPNNFCGQGITSMLMSMWGREGQCRYSLLMLNCAKNSIDRTSANLKLSLVHDDRVTEVQIQLKEKGVCSVQGTYVVVGSTYVKFCLKQRKWFIREMHLCFVYVF